MSGIKRKTFTVLKAALCVVLIVVSLFPIFWMGSLSIRGEEELRGELGFFPAEINFSHYQALFEKKGFGGALLNSVLVTLSSTGIALVFGIMCAYIMARTRFQFRGKRVLTYWVLLVRVMPPISLAIPIYLMFSRIGALSSLIPVISACVLINIPLTIWFIVSFFQDLPVEIEESAKIDGASELHLFLRIVLPLVLPGIAAVAMLSFISAWNEYTYSVVLVNSPQQYTVPLSLATINMDDSVTQYGLVASGGIISILPMALFIAFAQKYLVSGLSSGAVKE